MRTTLKAMLCGLALSTALSASTPALAAEASRIAVVNVQNIMRDSSAAKSMTEQLEAKKKAFQAELAKKEDALRKEGGEIEKQRATLSKEAFEAKAKAFGEKMTNAQKEAQQKKQTIDTAFERAIGQIQKAVEGIITDMAKEKGFDVALPTSQILYANTSLDISSEVLSRLNSKLAKVDVKFDGAAPAPAAKAEPKKN